MVLAQSYGPLRLQRKQGWDRYAVEKSRRASERPAERARGYYRDPS